MPHPKKNMHNVSYSVDWGRGSERRGRVRNLINKQSPQITIKKNICTRPKQCPVAVRSFDGDLFRYQSLKSEVTLSFSIY